MTIDEIIRYVSVGSKSLICIFRGQIENLCLFVISFYIMGKRGKYVLSVEFDPIDMVDNGEGWIWHSEAMDITKLIGIIERHLGVPLADWENVTKSGYLSFYDDDFDNDQYQKQEKLFINEMKLGETLLPVGIVWVKTAYDGTVNS